MDALDAAAEGDVALLSSILHDRLDAIGAESYERQTPLHVAAFFGHLAAMQFLVTHGANVSLRDIYGRTPMHIAVLKHSRKNPQLCIEICLLCLTAGADGDTTDREGWTPLMRAANDGNIELLRLLLYQSSPDLDRPRADNWTALTYAAANQRLEVLLELLYAGARTDLPMSGDLMPVMYAKLSGYSDVVDVLQHPLRVKL